MLGSERSFEVALPQAWGKQVALLSVCHSPLILLQSAWSMIVLRTAAWNNPVESKKESVTGGASGAAIGD